MATINTSMGLQDRISGSLNTIANNMNRTANMANRLDSTVANAGRSFNTYGNQANSGANSNTRFATTTNTVTSGLRTQEMALRQTGRGIQQAGNHAQNAGNKFQQMVQKLRDIGLAAIPIGYITGKMRELISVTDEYVNMQSRLGMIKEEGQSVRDLQNDIYKSAQRSGAEYLTMANSVAKLQMMTEGVFKNNEESVKFLEIMNKSFELSGSNAGEQKSAMLQLTQAMASGKLQGDEFRSLSETSPLLLKAIEKYTGMSRAEIRKIASEGQLSAEIVKNAMMAAGEDIEEKFKQMPMTAGRAWQMFTNFMIHSLQPVSDALTRILSSDGFQKFAYAAGVAVTVAINAIAFAMNLLADLLNFIGSAVEVVAGEWEWLQYIVYAFIAAVIAAHAKMLIIATWEAIVSGVKLAWQGLNAVIQFFNFLIMTNPLIFFLTLAIALVFGMAVATFGLAETVQMVFEYIGGIVGATIAIIYNLVIGLWNFIIGFAEGVANAGIWCINLIITVLYAWAETSLNILEFIYNAFVDMFNFVAEKGNDFAYFLNMAFYNVGKGVAKMAEAAAGVVDGLINSVLDGIEGMINSAIDGINKMISTVNNIPGVNIETLQQVSLDRSNIASAARAWGDSMVAPIKGAAAKLEKSAGLAKSLLGNKPQLENVNFSGAKGSCADLGNAWGAGASIGKGIGKGITDGVGRLMEKISGLMGGKEIENPLEAGGGIGDLSGTPGYDPSMLGPGNGKGPKGGKLDKVGKIEDKIDVSDEFMKLVKDLAEQKWQQNFITLKPEITTNIGTINEAGDQADFMRQFNDSLLDMVENSVASITG